MSNSNATIELKNVSKKFKTTSVIKGLDLKIEPGEFLVLLGPSGCGKSTTLRMIAGLEQVSSGKVMIDGSNLNEIKNDGHMIAMVFQDYALYPNMTVYQNLEYALKIHKVDKNVRKERIQKVLNTLNLNNYRDRLPSQLSGGQKQRVAVGRGMVKKSKIFLLDEPLSNIDVQLREKARDELQNLHSIDNQTIVYVTHDQMEAMALGDRIAVMNDGIIQMIDTPEKIYSQPANLFVAKFIGSPQINILEVNFTDSKLLSNNQVIMDLNDSKYAFKEQKYFLGIRPENVRISSQKDEKSIVAKVNSVVDYGRFIQLSIETMDGENLKAIVNGTEYKVNDEVFVTIKKESSILFDYSTEKNLNWSNYD